MNALPTSPFNMLRELAMALGRRCRRAGVSRQVRERHMERDRWRVHPRLLKAVAPRRGSKRCGRDLRAGENFTPSP